MSSNSTIPGLNITYSDRKGDVENNFENDFENNLANFTVHHPIYQLKDNNHDHHSQSTISLNESGQPNLSFLQSENEMLKKQISSLQRIITIKDSQINQLENDLKHFKANSRNSTNNNGGKYYSDEDDYSSDNSILKSPKRISNSKSGPTPLLLLNPLDSPIKQKQVLDNSVHQSSTIDSKSRNFEVPQRSEKRSRQSTNTIATNKDNNNSSNSNSKSNNKNYDKSHKTTNSISSATSSTYSDDEVYGNGDGHSDIEIESEKENEIEIANENESDDEHRKAPKLPEHPPHLPLHPRNQNDEISINDASLGSSPRKISPVRLALPQTPLDSVKFYDDDNDDPYLEFVDKDKTLENNESMNTEVNLEHSVDDGLEFGNTEKVNSTNTSNKEKEVENEIEKNIINEPHYKKFTSSSTPDSEMMITTNRADPISEGESSMAPSIALSNHPLSPIKISNNINNDINNDINQDIDNDSLYSRESSNKAHHRDNTPLSHPPLNSNISSSQQIKTPLQTPSIKSHDEAEPESQQLTSNSTEENKYNYLINSIDSTIITIETMVDPDAILNSHNNSNGTGNKSSDFILTFMVYSTEIDGKFKPLYRVKRSYNSFLKMDELLRPNAPNLKTLPISSSFFEIDYKIWAIKKNYLQSYINDVCQIVKENKKNQHIWIPFAKFFEINDTLEMSKRIGYFIPSKKFTKSFKIIKLVYDDFEEKLVINDLQSKIVDILTKNELSVSRRGQELLITKKRKKPFTNKQWSFYAESEIDAIKWYKLLSNDIDENNNHLTSPLLDQKQLQLSPSHNNSNSSINSGRSRDSYRTKDTPNLPNSPGSPSAISNIANNLDNNRWFPFKRVTNNNSNNSINNNNNNGNNNNSNNNNNNNNNGSNNILKFPNSPLSQQSFHQLSVPSTPSKSKDQLDSVLEFKSKPYLGVLSSSGNINNHEINSMSKSPIKTQEVFKPLDETPKYFGSTLIYSFELCPKYKLNGRPVPSIVYRCILYLFEHHAVGYEGIFRLNGMMSEINRIQSKFNKEFDCDLEKLDPKPDVHSIATLLKRYLRNLTNSLIPEELAVELTPLTIDSDHKKTSPIYKKIIHSLPKLNFDVIYVLFKYLRDVLRQKQFNKMSVGALSVLIAPNLTQNAGSKEICTEFLINFKYFFENGEMATDEGRKNL